ncbi:MAG: N-acetylglucosamine-6-phosphate deacetylase [Clostridiales bacterium]|nr:N-acetylglucosamine-6-phosphate deacetylase [Clostridiales bacterium]
MKAIVNGIILTEQGDVTGKALLFDDRFRGIVDADALTDEEIIDARGHYVAPGLVDVHIHGYLGEDTSDGSEEGIRTIARGILANGVTSFLPTTMTVDWAELENAFAVVRRLMPFSRTEDFDGAEILGCHAEGPFINPQRKGAQSADHILPPQADRLLAHRDIVRIVTMAPEMPGGIDFIKQVTGSSDIVVSIGHSSASYDQALEAIRAGASHITHLFNAMTGLNHREPGIVGAALTTDVYAELIADAFHVHSGLFSLLHVAKGDRLVLVTDCTRAGGLPDGEYTLGGQPIYVKGIESRLQDGTIAGSVLHLNDAVRNLYQLGGVSMRDAVHAASLSAARSIGADDRKGSIREGKDADFVLMDGNCQVYATYVGGVRKYAKEN